MKPVVLEILKYSRSIESVSHRYLRLPYRSMGVHTSTVSYALFGYLEGGGPDRDPVPPDSPHPSLHRHSRGYLALPHLLSPFDAACGRPRSVTYTRVGMGGGWGEQAHTKGNWGYDKYWGCSFLARNFPRSSYPTSRRYDADFSRVYLKDAYRTYMI